MEESTPAWRSGGVDTHTHTHPHSHIQKNILLQEALVVSCGGALVVYMLSSLTYRRGRGSCWFMSLDVLSLLPVGRSGEVVM